MLNFAERTGCGVFIFVWSFLHFTQIYGYIFFARIITTENTTTMAQWTTFRKPQSKDQSSLELLQQLPLEILDRILFAYCDGKALSTLAVALSTSLNNVYCNIAYHVIPAISKCLLLKIVDNIETNRIDGFNHAGVIRWIRLIAAEHDNSDESTNKNDESHNQINTSSNNNKQCSNDNNSIDHDTITESKSQHVIKIRRKIMRYCSENFAVADFLHKCMMESQCCGQWEWPVWVGQISVSVIVDATVARSMTHIVILAPFDFPCHIPGSSLLYRHRTPTSLFRCEPMNMIPVPPWGRLQGLTTNDEVALKRIALRLEEAGESHVVVPSRNQEHDPLNIRILSKKDARLRVRDAAPRLGPHLFETLTWLVHDNSMVNNNDDDNDNNNNELTNPLELVCCWENDTMDEILPREYIEYLILLMKTRDRLINESNTVSYRCIASTETTNCTVFYD